MNLWILLAEVLFAKSIHDCQKTYQEFGALVRESAQNTTAIKQATENFKLQVDKVCPTHIANKAQQGLEKTIVQSLKKKSNMMVSGIVIYPMCFLGSAIVCQTIQNVCNSVDICGKVMNCCGRSDFWNIPWCIDHIEGQC